MKAIMYSVLLAAGLAVIAWAVYSGINTRAERMGNARGVGNGQGGGGSTINRAGKVRWDF